MCIIVYQPEGKPVTEKILEKCHERNSNGMGFMYVSDTGLKVEKFMTFPAYMDAYRIAYNKYGDKSKFVSHFRIKTHGTISVDNCHPFIIRPGLAFAHNGVINKWRPEETLVESDSKLMCKVFQMIEYRDFHMNEAVKTLIEKYGGYSKFAFLDDENRVSIVNEKAGTWKDGIWYSNSWVDFDDHKEYNGSYVSGYSYVNCDVCGRRMLSSSRWMYTIVNSRDQKLDVCNSCIRSGRLCGETSFII